MLRASRPTALQGACSLAVGTGAAGACHPCRALPPPYPPPQTAATTSTVGTSLGTAGAAMAKMGAATDVKQMQKTMMQFGWVGAPLLPASVSASGCQASPVAAIVCARVCRDCRLDIVRTARVRQKCALSPLLRHPALGCRCMPGRATTAPGPDPASSNGASPPGQAPPPCSRENAKMEMAGEMMDSAIEDALDGDGVEEETEDVVAQVCVCGGG